MNARIEVPRGRVVRSEAVVPRTMAEAEREALVDALLAVYADIFAGATREYIADGLVSPKSEFTTILLHRNADDQIVGYFAIHFFERRFRGVATTVVRSSVGMLRAYRGRNANIGWALGVLLKQRLAHPGRPMFGMGSFVHPSSYLQVARYVDTFWPRPDEPVPPDMLEFIVELADEFQMRRIDPAQPLIRAGSMPTRESEAERDYWRRSDKPAARFFVAMNPAYSQGNGLVTMFPIDASMLTGIASRIVRERARLLVEGTLAVAQRLPLVDRLLRPRAVRRQLQAVPLFAALDGSDLQRVLELAAVVALPAGHTLFRAGDAGDDLYVVACGAVAVQASTIEGEVMIDQLGAGSLFGEIAVLAGGRRKASVRTVIPTTLVRIPGPALRAAMHRAPLGDAIREVFAARIFDDHLRASGRHRDLGRAERLAWVRRGRLVELEPGARLPVSDAAFVVVLHGDVLIEQGGSQLSAQAPVVVEVTPSTVIRATTRARTVHVPPLAERGPAAEAS
ncbi:cyclic nucleotide-binding domain-containing protein [Nannocystis sp. SCPEA4]|uniref:cyclic nucleotide-binding domain-containing protein n=1 Tax=Nannocystis sp. SCPEA4 TaxID=2996787 RepID=UPI00226D5BF8|nr:cyclic nucleotide-binding domain-containing protein [Nannocystis sp. SCPEA4]